jgi:hypothetical protein
MVRGVCNQYMYLRLCGKCNAVGRDCKTIGSVGGPYILIGLRTGTLIGMCQTNRYLKGVTSRQLSKACPVGFFLPISNHILIPGSRNLD